MIESFWSLGEHKMQSSIFDTMERMEHEELMFWQNEEFGLKAIIGIHSTVLGPALGGLRLYPYQSEADAIKDVLRLSRGMSYKAAISGLDLGGGKAVIIGTPEIKSEGLFRAFGRHVESLGGRYITAEDMKKLNGERFFEVYNGHPWVHNEADDMHISVEEMWDIINVSYYKQNKPLLYGVATDDSHNYHEQSSNLSNSGRGWIMVESDSINTESLIDAMETGNFYASSGIYLKKVIPR